MSAIDWTPPIASALGKTAIALVLLDWHRTSALGVGVIAALAWSGVQVYTGVVFVTAGVLAALIADPLARRDWRAARRNAAIVTLVVFALQIPYLVHRLRTTRAGRRWAP